MAELVIAPGPGVAGGLTIPAGELEERFARALSPAQRVRLLNNLAGRLVGTTLTVDAADQRSQFLNRRAARERLADALRHALAPPPPARRRTRPTRGSVARRLAAKRHQAEKKALRRSHED